MSKIKKKIAFKKPGIGAFWGIVLFLCLALTQGLQLVRAEEPSQTGNKVSVSSDTATYLTTWNNTGQAK